MGDKIKDGSPEAQLPTESSPFGFYDEVMNPPEWLTAEYLQLVLQNYENDPKLKITSHSFKPCTKPGDNYIGVLFRCGVNYETRGETKSDSFIIKIEAFMEGAKMDLVAGQPMFATETQMYAKVLPLMQELLTSAGDPEVLVPKLIHHSNDPHNILIFSDLTKEGFEVVRETVTYEKVVQIARKLGKFHALSFFIHAELKNDIVTGFTKGMFSAEDISDWQHITTTMEVLIDLLREWNQEKIADKLKALNPHLLQRMVKLFQAQEKGLGFNVLNHGDLDIINMMFLIDDVDQRHFKDTRLIDFQMCVWATPAIDLSQLLNAVANVDCIEANDRDRLVKIYHDQFKATLNALGYLGLCPSLLDVQLELLRNGLMELISTTTFLPFKYFNLEDLGEGSFMDPELMAVVSRKTFQHPEMKRVLLHVLPRLMYQGVLDVDSI